MGRAGRSLVAGTVTGLLVLISGPGLPAATAGRAAVRPDAVGRPGFLPAAPVGPAAPVTYRAPVAGRLVVLRGFQPPATAYAAGHRGVDLAAPGDALIRAAGPGHVSFAGPVAGRGVVVVSHPDGVTTEYEPVLPLVRAGQVVAAGDPVGRLHGPHGGCRLDGCVHWGARRQGTYFDPLTLLRPLGPVRLLPWS
jgi:murein DD-endopeptidase MepM/ murein hydrolase activator NlpD